MRRINKRHSWTRGESPDVRPRAAGDCDLSAAAAA